MAAAAMGGVSGLSGRAAQQAQAYASTEKFAVHGFHSLDFWCADATSAAKRFQHGLGMQLVAKSDASTGASAACSYALRSGDVIFAFTAPYKTSFDPSTCPVPNFHPDTAFRFVQLHGLAVRAIAISVDCAFSAFFTAVADGAEPLLEPTPLAASSDAHTVSEVRLYGDVALRFVSGSSSDPYLTGYTPVDPQPSNCAIGFERVDHCVGNVPLLEPQVEYMRNFSGFHRFAHFNAEEVGSRESGLNSTVVASDNRMVLLPVNEPTYGTQRKSQIQMYLEENEGSGVQHIALKTSDIFSTVREMRGRSESGGFKFMPKPPNEYYCNAPNRLGNALTEEQYRLIEELGILADVDEEGVLLQVFTKPVTDRATLFLEIIQRVGCETVHNDGNVVQKPGCGGFGKGNFKELFKQVERFQDEAGLSD
jgi:4-hydroxyphenylpyruvate dioxygenase